MTKTTTREIKELDHQVDCWSALENARANGADKALVIMASGLGKTVMAIIDAKRFIEEHGGRVLCLCHRNDILDQLKREFEEVMEVLEGEYTFGMYNGNEKCDFLNGSKVDFLFTSFQTMANDFRRGKFERDEFTYIIVDEAHHAPARTFYQTLKYFTPDFLLGMTATPDRKDKADLNVIFGETVYEIRFAEAIARGKLAWPKVRLLMDEVAKLGEIYWKEAKRKIPASELNKRMFAAVRDKAIVDTIKDELAMANVTDPRMVVFCRGVRHAENIAALIDGAVLFHSYEHRLPRADAKKNLQAFRDGTAKTIVVIDKFNEGIDVPEINVVVNLRQLGSRIPAEQQLGRGLRLHPSKDFVLVLDFVANCQRIKMYWEMDRDLKKARKVHPDDLKRRGGGGGGSEDLEGIDITTNVPWFEKKDLELLIGMTEPYTREELIGQLQRWSREHDGKTPTVADIDSDPEMACSKVFQRIFGSNNAACKAAGLEINHQRYDDRPDEEILDLLRDWSERNGGKTPTKDDIESDQTMPSSIVYTRRFGSITAAQKAAGLLPNKENYTGVDDEEILDLLRDWSERNGGKTPTSEDINSDKTMPSTVIFIKRFGSVTAAQKAAGLKPTATWYSETELLDYIRCWSARNNGKTPNSTDIASDLTMPSLDTYISRFGSVANAQKAAGFRPTTKFWSNDDIIIATKTWSEENGGKIPKSKDYKSDPTLPSDTTCRERFGSIPALLVAAGLMMEK